jgi:hypothetical protein
MAIPGKQTIYIGLQNESTGSDSLYTAFHKTVNNFDTLFTDSSPFNTFTGNTGIAVASNPTSGTVTITNTGVTSIVAGTDIIVSSSNGEVTISSTGGGNGGGGTVTSVGVASSTLSISNSPIISTGNIAVDLPVIAGVAGTYTYPTVTVDAYGRIATIANATSAGTVTNIGFIPDTGIQITGGPITTSGNITILNTGVTRLNPGTGISLSGSNGNVTISTTVTGGTVTSVGLSSNSLTITSSPITTAGTITVDLPTNTVVTGNITGGNLITAGFANIGANANIGTTLSVLGNANVGNLITAGFANIGNINVPNGRSNVTGTANAVGGGATVGVRSILAIDSAFGSNDANDPASAQAVHRHRYYIY